MYLFGKVNFGSGRPFYMLRTLPKINVQLQYLELATWHWSFIYKYTFFELDEVADGL